MLNSDIIEGLNVRTKSSAPFFCVAITIGTRSLEKSYALIMRVKSSIVVCRRFPTPDNRSYNVVRVSSYDTFYRREKRAKKLWAEKKSRREKNLAI